MDKAALREAIIRQLEADLALQTAAALNSRAEATDEESKPENKYDMHAQEAAYLAEGQARLVADLREALTHVSSLPLASFGPNDAIALGALVTIETDGRPRHYFLGPRSGGTEVTIGDTTVLVITPASPLGRQLLGRRLGDPVTLPGSKHPERISRVL